MYICQPDIEPLENLCSLFGYLFGLIINDTQQYDVDKLL